MVELVGLKFKYNSKYGLSNWTGTIKNVHHRWNVTLGDGIAHKSIEMYISTEESEVTYNLDDVVFVILEDDRIKLENIQKIVKSKSSYHDKVTKLLI